MAFTKDVIVTNISRSDSYTVPSPVGVILAPGEDVNLGYLPRVTPALINQIASTLAADAGAGKIKVNGKETSAAVTSDLALQPGVRHTATLASTVSSATTVDSDRLAFDSALVGAVEISYNIQRGTTSEGGTLMFSADTSGNWAVGLDSLGEETSIDFSLLEVDGVAGANPGTLQWKTALNDGVTSTMTYEITKTFLA